jgi:hypothetical protein
MISSTAREMPAADIENSPENIELLRFSKENFKNCNNYSQVWGFFGAKYM